MDTRRLKPIQRVVQGHENDRAREFAAQRKTLQTHEQRLEELRGFAAEYASDAAGKSINAALFANRRAFVEKLDSAVSQQITRVEKAREHCDIERARLMLASREVAVMDRLAASYHARERKQVERRDQRDLDEHAQRGLATVNRKES
jgi:flagellar protein FliJ